MFDRQELRAMGYGYAAAIPVALLIYFLGGGLLAAIIPGQIGFIVTMMILNTDF